MPDHSDTVIPGEVVPDQQAKKKPIFSLVPAAQDSVEVKDADTPLQKEFHEELEKQNSQPDPKKTYPGLPAKLRNEMLRGIFISNNEYDVTRNTGVSIMYNPLENVLEEKIRVIDKKTRVAYVVDIPLAVALRVKGLKFIEIAKYFEMPEKILFDSIKPYLPEDYCVELYTENRTSILQSIQARLIAHLTPDKIARANLKDIALAFGVMFDKERLQENKSTENVAVGFAGIVEGLHKRVAKEDKKEQKENERTDG